MKTRPGLLAAVAAAEHKVVLARAIVRHAHRAGVPVDGGAITRAEAKAAEARAALAQHDARS